MRIYHVAKGVDVNHVVIAFCYGDHPATQMFTCNCFAYLQSLNMQVCRYVPSRVHVPAIETPVHGSISCDACVRHIQELL